MHRRKTRHFGTAAFCAVRLVCDVARLRLNVGSSDCREQSRCAAKTDAETVAGFLDRGRETVALAAGGRSMATVSVISVIPVASRQDSSLPLSAA